MYCPKFNGKCVQSKCVAYKSNKPSLNVCNVCGQKFLTGGSCLEDNHRSEPKIVERYYKCLEYDVEIIVLPNGNIKG